MFSDILISSKTGSINESVFLILHWPMCVCTSLPWEDASAVLTSGIYAFFFLLWMLLMNGNRKCDSITLPVQCYVKVISVSRLLMQFLNSGHNYLCNSYMYANTHTHNKSLKMHMICLLFNSSRILYYINLMFCFYKYIFIIWNEPGPAEKKLSISTNLLLLLLSYSWLQWILWSIWDTTVLLHCPMQSTSPWCLILVCMS